MSTVKKSRQLAAQPLELETDGRLAGGEVNVPIRQAQHLVLAQPEHQNQDISRVQRVSVTASGLKEPASVLGRPGPNLAPARAGSFASAATLSHGARTVSNSLEMPDIASAGASATASLVQEMPAAAHGSANRPAQI